MSRRDGGESPDAPHGAELVGYLRHHAESDLALVSVGHMCELHELAGRPCPGFRGGFMSIVNGQADDLLDAADARLAMPWLSEQRGASR